MFVGIFWILLAISSTPYWLVIATWGVGCTPHRKVCEFGMSGRWGLLVKHLTGLAGWRDFRAPNATQMLSRRWIQFHCAGSSICNCKFLVPFCTQILAGNYCWGWAMPAALGACPSLDRIVGQELWETCSPLHHTPWSLVFVGYLRLSQPYRALPLRIHHLEAVTWLDWSQPWQCWHLGYWLWHRIVWWNYSFADTDQRCEQMEPVYVAPSDLVVGNGREIYGEGSKPFNNLVLRQS